VMSHIGCLVTLCLVLGSELASAQTQPATATLTLVEGAVYLGDQLIAAGSGPVVLGDSATLRTVRGRAVIGLRRGGVLTMDENSQVRVGTDDIYHFSRVEVLEGTAIVISQTSAPVVSCRNSARVSTDGIFRFDVRPGRPGGGVTCRFRVYSGRAEVALVTVPAVVGSGHALTLDPGCGDMTPTVEFPAEQLDDFDRWSRQQAGTPRLVVTDDYV
jgi:hypothetical protein